MDLFFDVVFYIKNYTQSSFFKRSVMCVQDKLVIPYKGNLESQFFSPRRGGVDRVKIVFLWLGISIDINEETKPDILQILFWGSDEDP